jgi:hypothetical protein
MFYVHKKDELRWVPLALSSSLSPSLAENKRKGKYSFLKVKARATGI